jgi:hypothetical protein
MTREIYTHVTDTMLQEAAGAIERIMGDGGTNGSSSGSRDDNNAEDDEDQEPGYGVWPGSLSLVRGGVEPPTSRFSVDQA